MTVIMIIDNFQIAIFTPKWLELIENKSEMYFMNDQKLQFHVHYGLPERFTAMFTLQPKPNLSILAAEIRQPFKPGIVMQTWLVFFII